MNLIKCKCWLLLLGIGIVMLSCDKTMNTEERNHDIPIVRLSVDEHYLWSPDSGLYVIGNNGILSCGEVANYNQKWEYPAEIEYSIDGEVQFHERVGFRIKGFCSRNRSTKSFGIYWRKEYGSSKLKYALFEDIDVTKFKRVLLRTSANALSHINDVAISTIYKDFANVDYQEYKPCALYLNEEYWGLYYIREMLTPHHFKYHYGVDDDAVDLLGGSGGNPEVDDGSKDDYMNDVADFLRDNDMSIQSNYESICEHVDIQSYMDYIIINTYIAKCDWPGNNGKWWRDKTSVDFKKWRWVTYDADWSFQIENVEDVLIGELYGVKFSMGVASSFYLFNGLIANEEFKALFLERYLYFVDVVFEKQRVKDIITTIKGQVENEYPNHSQRWSKPSVRAWNKSVDDLIQFNNERNDIMRDIINRLQNEG